VVWRPHTGHAGWMLGRSRFFLANDLTTASSWMRETHHVDSTFQPPNGAFYAPNLTRPERRELGPKRNANHPLDGRPAIGFDLCPTIAHHVRMRNYLTPYGKPSVPERKRPGHTAGLASINPIGGPNLENRQHVDQNAPAATAPTRATADATPTTPCRGHNLEIGRSVTQTPSGRQMVRCTYPTRVPFARPFSSFPNRFWRRIVRLVPSRCG